MFNMMDMFGKVKEFQARMKEAQASLNTITESGESGAGMVRVTVNGLKQVVRLTIDPDLIRPDDREMLQDLVVAATNKALENVEPKIKDHLQKATEGLLPNIPGFDLGNLMS
jgi:DNA-binding YbaB/EbfC family protein